METGSYRGRPRFHGNESSVTTIEYFARFMGTFHILEHPRNHLKFKERVKFNSIKFKVEERNLNSTADEQIDDIGPQGVAILVEESVSVVPDLSGVVFDAEFHGGHSRPEVELVESVIVVALFEERAVGRLGKVGFVVQQM